MCDCNSCQMGRRITTAIDSDNKELVREAFDELWNAYESESLDRQWLEMKAQQFTEGEICIQETDDGRSIRFVKIIEDNGDDIIFRVKPVSAWYEKTKSYMNNEIDCHVSRLRKNKDYEVI